MDIVNRANFEQQAPPAPPTLTPATEGMDVSRYWYRRHYRYGLNKCKREVQRFIAKYKLAINGDIACEDECGGQDVAKHGYADPNTNYRVDQEW